MANKILLVAENVDLDISMAIEWPVQSLVEIGELLFTFYPPIRRPKMYVHPSPRKRSVEAKC